MSQPFFGSMILTLSSVLFLAVGALAQTFRPVSGALFAKLDCPDRVKGVAFSSDGKLSDFRNGLFALAVSHSEKLFAVAGGDYGSGGDLSLWTLSDVQEVGYVSFGEFPIQALAFNPDDSILAAGSDDGFV